MDFHYTIETNKTVDEAIEALEQNMREHKFGILWQLDLPAKLQEKGVDSYTTPYRILEVCNPHEAAKVLNHNEIVGYFLPCKIVVYQSGRSTKIGLPKPSALISVLGDEQLKGIAQDIEKTLIGIIEKSK